MPDPRPRLYEGLFLLDQHAVAADFSGCVEHVQGILEHVGAEIIVLKKWNECRLAYEIKGQKRGTYLLSYFNVEGSKIATIERNCNLSEKVLRHMFLQADHIGETELELAKKDDTLATESALRSGSDNPKPPPKENTGDTQEPKVQVESNSATTSAPAGA